MDTLPLGEGEASAAPVSPEPASKSKAGRASSLSQRERAGVRESGHEVVAARVRPDYYEGWYESELRNGFAAKNAKRRKEKALWKSK